MEQRLDFKATVETLTGLSTKAQCTFLYLLISVLNPMVLRTIMRYCCRRLDQINKELPDTHPYKQQYLSRGRREGGPKLVCQLPVQSSRDFYINNLREEERW